MARNILPAVTMDLMKIEKAFFLVVVPRLLVYSWVEVIVPPFATLLACSHGN